MGTHDMHPVSMQRWVDAMLCIAVSEYLLSLEPHDRVPTRRMLPNLSRQSMYTRWKSSFGEIREEMSWILATINIIDYIQQTGTTWIEEPCTHCSCTAGRVHCFKQKCPEISCPEHQQSVRRDGECCPACVDKMGTP